MITTNVDRLLDILERKKRVSITDIATQLNTNIKQIEKLGEFLEEEGILIMEYGIAKSYLKLLKLPDKKTKLEKEEAAYKMGENKEYQNSPSEIMSTINNFIRTISMEDINMDNMPAVLDSYSIFVNTNANKISRDKDLLYSCCKFTEISSFKKFQLSAQAYKFQNDLSSMNKALQDYDSFNETIQSLISRYSYNPDNDLIIKAMRIKNEM